MKITKGKVKKPYFMVLYGREKIGKTTFAAGAEDALIIGPEDGSNNLDVARNEPSTSYDDVMNDIQWLVSQEHSFKTVVVDSITKLEPMVWKSVCALDNSKTIDDAQKGYGKGYVVANQYWQKMIDALFMLRARRSMNVIAIAHALPEQFNDPLLMQPYNRYFLQMNKKAAALWTREVDCLGFASVENYLKEGDNEKLNRAVSENKRVLHLAPSPAFEAGNRLGLPDSMLLDYKEFSKALSESTPKEQTIEEIKVTLVDMAKKVKDEPTRKAALDFIAKATTKDQLRDTYTRLNQIS